jgi:hypothetical protein
MELGAYIYDPGMLVSELEKGKTVRKATKAATLGVIIVGSIGEEDGNCNGAWQVKKSWARDQGDGRMVYGLGFAMAPDGVLVPDRGSVSSSAGAGWGKAADKGFPSQPLDDIRSHDDEGRMKFPHADHTDDPADDCVLLGDKNRPHLDRSYTHPDRGTWLTVADAMEVNHEATIEQVSAAFGIERRDIELAVRAAANGAFVEALP